MLATQTKFSFVDGMKIIGILMVTTVLSIGLYHTIVSSESSLPRSRIDNKYKINDNYTSNLSNLSLKPELHIISYRSTNRCSNYAKKKGGNCGMIMRYFCNTLRINGLMNISINYIGDNEKKEYVIGHIAKILDVYEYLIYFAKQYSIEQQKKSIIVMFVDAWDTVFQQSSQVILDRFLEMKQKSASYMQNRIIWQAEHECSPGHPRNIDRSIYCNKALNAYPTPPNNNNNSDVDAQYLNGGGWIGYLYDVIANFKQFMDFINITGGHDAKGDWRGDQEIISMHFINRSEYMTLDYYSYIMQAMIRMENTMQLKDKGWYNPNMKHYPSVLHFNGDKKFLERFENLLANKLFPNNNGKINGDHQITLTNYNVSRTQKYSQICGQFKNWYY